MINNFADQDLIDHFAGRGNFFTNSEGMEMGWVQDHRLFWTNLTLDDHSSESFEISISPEDENAWKFITGFRLQGAGDLDRLNHINSWMRYWNGEAEITVTPYEVTLMQAQDQYREKHSLPPTGEE